MAFVWNPYRQLIIRNAWWIVLLALDRNLENERTA